MNMQESTYPLLYGAIPKICCMHCQKGAMPSSFGKGTKQKEMGGYFYIFITERA